jgi:hypothetical protein
MKEHCHTKLLATLHSLFAIRYSLLAAVLTFASRYSLPFPDLPICRFHDLPKTWLGRNFALPLSALQKSHPPVANCQSPFAIRHSLPQRDGLRNLPAVVTIFWLGDA